MPITYSDTPGHYLIDINLDDRITFGEGVTAVDRGDEIELTGPGLPRLVSGPTAAMIDRTPGQPERRVPLVPLLRTALANEGVPTTVVP